MSIITFGINHQSAPISIRERLAFTPQMLPSAIKQLTAHKGINEAVILSTCNRTEIYSATIAATTIKEWLVTHHQLQDIDITPFSYYHQGEDAVKHLMRVASGLDSMVIGEPQILGQIKDAYQLAETQGCIGHHLQQLFPAVFATSKHVRSSTNIGKCPVSIAYAVVQLCKDTFKTLSDRKVLLVGAGTTMELVATHLDHCSIEKMFVANRNIDRANTLANAFNATPMIIGDIPSILNQVDIVISATASQLPILGKGLFERVLSQNPSKQFFIADLAIPRDVEPEVGELPPVSLYNIDDLRNTINENLNSRHSAGTQAESMIEMYAANYMRQLRINDAGDIIRHYREHISALRDIELKKSANQLQQGKDPQAVMTNFGRNLIHKIMHDPTIKLRQAASDGQLNLLMLAKELFEPPKE